MKRRNLQNIPVFANSLQFGISFAVHRCTGDSSQSSSLIFTVFPTYPTSLELDRKDQYPREDSMRHYNCVATRHVTSASPPCASFFTLAQSATELMSATLGDSLVSTLDTGQLSRRQHRANQGKNATFNHKRLRRA